MLGAVIPLFRKDSRLPAQLQRAMAAEAEAAREAKAKIIRSDAELKATTYITRAAEVLSESSGGMQLRYLQVSPVSSTKCNAPLLLFKVRCRVARKFCVPCNKLEKKCF